MEGKYKSKPTPIRNSPHFAQKLARTNSSPAATLTQSQSSRGPKIDPQVYTDTLSKGLSSRIVLYYDRNHREPKPIINRLYNRAGEFPVVHINQNTHSTHRLRRRSLTVGHSTPQIKIYKSPYQSYTRSEIRRTGFLVAQQSPSPIPTQQDPKQLHLTREDVDTLAPLDALKEISRKRIHCDQIDGDQNKKQKPESTVAAAAAVAAASTKRQRDAISPTTNNNVGGVQKKRPCTKNNDILSSLSSSLSLITPKRKKDDTRNQQSVQLEPQQMAIKHRRNDIDDRNDTPLSQPQQRIDANIAIQRPVEIKSLRPPAAVSANSFAAIQPVPSTPNVAKLTLFNKTYVPNTLNRLDTQRENASTDDDDEPAISYVKPKKLSTNITTITTKAPVEKTKLALMLSCLSGDLDDLDDIVDAPIVAVAPVTEPVALITASKPQTNLSSENIPAIAVPPVQPVAVGISVVPSATIMPSISAASALLTSPIKFTTTTETKSDAGPAAAAAAPAAQRQGGFAFAVAPTIAVPAPIPATTVAMPAFSFAASKTVVSPVSSVTPAALPAFTFGANKPVASASTTVPVASPSISTAPIAFDGASLVGASSLTAITGFNSSSATTALSTTVATQSGAPVFSFGGTATVSAETPKPNAQPTTFGGGGGGNNNTTTTTTTTIKPISTQQFGVQTAVPAAFHSVASAAFGSPSTAITTAHQNPEQPTAFGSSQSLFSKPNSNAFGAATKETTAYAVSAPAAAPQSSAFMFGGGSVGGMTTTQVKTPSFGSATTEKPVAFGATASSNSSNQPSLFDASASQQQTQSTFGAVQQQSVQQTASPFGIGTAASSSFGSNQFAPPVFGSGSTSTVTSPIFGDATTQKLPFGGANAAKPIFGGATSNGNFGTQQQPAATTSSGIFGTQPAAQMKTFPFGGSVGTVAAPATSSAAFTFGGSSAAPATTAAAPATTAATPGQATFSFGPSEATPPTTTTASTSAFAFGGSTSVTAPATTSAFAFGATSTAAAVVATPAQTPAFSFNGGSSSNSKPTASSGPFSFGGGGSTVQKTGSFSGPQAVASGTPLFSFSGGGGGGGGNQSIQAQSPSAPSFGGAATMSFGSVASNQQQLQPGGSAFTFGSASGGSQILTPTGGAFSFSAQQPAASSNYIFGPPASNATPSSAAAPFAFGGSSSSGGGGSSSVGDGGAFNFSAQTGGPQSSPAGGNLFNPPKTRVIRQASRRINK